MTVKGYQRLSESLIKDLGRDLLSGSVIALYGPRQGGKRIVLSRLEQSMKSHDLSQAGRLRVLRFGWGDIKTQDTQKVLQWFCARLAVDADAQQTALAEGLIRIVRSCAASSRLVVMVDNVLEFPWPVAKALLACFHQLHEDGVKGFGAVVAGTSDFLQLLEGPTSPFRKAQQVLLTGMSFEEARTFVAHTRRHQLGIVRSGDARLRQLNAPLGETTTAQMVDDDAAEFIFNATSGMPHLIQEIMLSSARHLDKDTAPELGPKWTLEIAQWATKRFVEHHMGDDYHARKVVRVAERAGIGLPGGRPAFDVLLELRDGRGVELFSGELFHPYEALGLARVGDDSLARVSCDVWSAFLKQELTPRHVADTYVLHRRWRDAWTSYGQMEPEQRFRPLTAEASARLNGVLSAWIAGLFDNVRSVQELSTFFLTGAKHILAFDAGAVLNRTADGQIRPVPTKDAGNTTSYGPVEIALSETPRLGEQVAWREGDDIGAKAWCPQTQHVLVSTLPGHPKIPGINEAVLTLQRSGDAPAMDTAELGRVLGCVRAFWQAFLLAVQRDHEKTLGALRELLLSAMQELAAELGKTSGLGSFVTLIPSLLVRSRAGGYHFHRVQVCLVSPDDTEIQGIASDCVNPDDAFKYGTNFRVFSVEVPQFTWDQLRKATAAWYRKNCELAHEGRKLDVQQWVVMSGRVMRIVARHPAEWTEYVQTQSATRVSHMHDAVVVPMIHQARVVGTLHFELKTGALPSDGEIDLMVDFGRQVADLFFAAQRLDALALALDELADPLRIVGPGPLTAEGQRHVLFANRAAAAVHGCPSGWQSTRRPCSCRRIDDTGHSLCLVRQVAGQEGSPSLRMHTNNLGENAERTVFDSFVGELRDFRKDRLQEPYQASPLVGYVEHEHDMGMLIGLQHAMNDWAATRNERDLSERIKAYLLADKTFAACEFHHCENRASCDCGGDEGRLPGVVEARSRQGLAFLVYCADEGTRLVDTALKSAKPFDALRAAAPHAWVSMAGDAWCVRLLLKAVQPIAPMTWQRLRMVQLSSDIAFLRLRAEHDLLLATKASVAAEERGRVDSLRRFVMITSHAINTPASEVRNAAIVLSRHDCTPDRQQRHLTVLKKCGAKLMRVSQQLSLFRRNYAQAVDMAPGALSAWLREYLASASWEGAPLCADIRIDGDVVTDWFRLEMVFDQLVSNSRTHFTPAEGCDSLVMRVVAYRTQLERPADQGAAMPSEYLVVEFSDNGPGVRESLRRGLFGFDQSNWVDTGTGMGLLLCSDVVRRMQGTIALKEQNAKGACFVLCLPQTRDNEKEERDETTVG